MKPVAAGMPSAPIAVVMKKMKMSQKTTPAMALAAEAPGRTASMWRLAELSWSRPVDADPLKELADHARDDLRHDVADQQDQQESQQVGQEVEESVGRVLEAVTDVHEGCPFVR